MKTPLHFSTSRDFRLYVFRCALRDRESYRDSISHCKDDMDQQKRETDREIACIEAEISRLAVRRDL